LPETLKLFVVSNSWRRNEDWTVWRVDFSRAFRKDKDLRFPKNLVKCDRQLLEKLKALKSDELTEKTKDYQTI
jgi:hypothetical protein